MSRKRKAYRNPDWEQRGHGESFFVREMIPFFDEVEMGASHVVLALRSSPECLIKMEALTKQFIEDVGDLAATYCPCDAHERQDEQ
jgi:hypothetical protein